MARDDDDDDSLPPLGENTDKFLDQAKKGQARNFLLVCKGNKVKYLAVRKKPIKKNELNEAKKSGYKGEGYFGVITGKGMELVFNLSTADGYISEPVKDKVLKDFLEEKADFKCKPTIVIVATLPEIPFDDEDLNNPLIARFLALDVPIAQVLDRNPDSEGELKQTTSEIRALLQDGDFNQAEPRIFAFEARLQELLQGAQADGTQSSTSTGTIPQPNAPVVDENALKQKLQEALNKLVPQLKQAVQTYPDKKVELLTPVAQIKNQLDSGDLQEARRGILAVAQLLKSVSAEETQQNSGQPQNQTKDSQQDEYERKLTAIQPDYERALREQLGDTNKFRAVMTYAREQGEAGVYGNAIKALDRLAQAISQAISSGAKETSVVREGSVETTGAGLQLKLARLEAARGIGTLEEALRVSGKKRALEIAQIVSEIASRFPNHLESILDSLEKATNSKDLELANKLKESARTAIKDWFAYLKTHQLEIEGCEKNPWKLPVSINAPISKSLENILNTVLA